MSLQVWLPLDNHLRNQGLDSVKFNGSSVTYSQGKIGYAASGATISGTSTELTSTFGFTFGLWVKIPTGTKSQSIVSIPMNNGNKNTSLIAYKMDYDAVKLHEASNNPQMVWSYTDNGKWTYDSWFHYVVTVHNTDSAVKVKVYINGELAHDYSNANYRFTLIPGKISLSGDSLKNDFRIYDHCLTPKEIEEWSRGLLLHYPLRDSAIEGTVNYASYPTNQGAYTTTSWDQSLHPDAIKVSGWGLGLNTGVSNPSTGYHAYWKMVEDEPTIVFNNLNSIISSKGRWLGVSGNGTSSFVNVIGTSKPYTISFEAKGSIPGMTIRTGLYYAKSGTTTRGFHDGQKDFVLTTDWKRYSFTWTLGSDVNMSAESSIYIYGHYGKEGTSMVRRIQLETKNHATDFTIGTRTPEGVADCSGFEHHGQVNGTVSILNEGARHNASLYQTDGRTNYIASKNIVFPSDTITMCCWVKGSGAGYSNYHIPLSFNSGAYEMSLEGNNGSFRGGFHINGARQCYTSGGKTIDGTWHFIAITYDGSTIRKYVDAVECQANAHAGALSGGVGQLLVGNYNGTTYGNKELQTSDVRIYATALSPAALKELYTIGATIDKNGTMYGYDFVEKDANSVFKTGVVDFSKITEYNINRFKWYDGELWAQILHHNNKNGTVLFPSAQADNYTSDDAYSRLYLIEDLRGADGSFEFLALQPDDDPDSVYRWIQTNNPTTSTTGTGFKNISGMTGALVKCSGCTYWAISGTTSNWWNAVGCYSAYNGGIPGFGKVVVKGSLDVYVKVDKRSSILQDTLEVYNLYEF